MNVIYQKALEADGVKTAIEVLIATVDNVKSKEDSSD